MSDKYIVAWSGGKDSTYLVDFLIKNNKPIDEIIFCDTGYEFPYLKDYVLKVSKYWKSLGYKVTLINWGKGKEIWDKWMFGKFSRGNYKGKIRGFPPTLGMSYCTRELKVVPFDKYIKNNYKNCNIIKYIGYAYNEPKRYNNKKENELYPLVEAKINEDDILKWVMNKDNFYYNALYEDFSRLGCYICPKQPKRSIEILIKKYPEYWEEIKLLEKQLTKLDARFALFGINGIKYYEENK